MDMKFVIKKCELSEILPFRELFLNEANFEIRYNACHERGFTDSYSIRSGEQMIGYGAVMGQEVNDRDTLFEFYVIPAYRSLSSDIFSDLLDASDVRFIECQSNDFFLSRFLYEFGENINSNVVLFEDSHHPRLAVNGAVFRRIKESDIIFEHTVESVGKYVLEINDVVVATGGFMTHYNPPFADLYMEVHPEYRMRGYGSFLLQEVKRVCYASGRVPAARTRIGYHQSRRTLEKAGLRVCGFMLIGNRRTERRKPLE